MMAYLRLILQEGNFMRCDGLLRDSNNYMNEKNSFDSCEQGQAPRVRLS
jgi:hypothetical protein